MTSPETNNFNWDTAVVYQVYPRSFNEAGPEPHKGEGNLKGVIEKLDYLTDLGVNAIWISPFYPSPMKDGGYDISDYMEIDPRFGNMSDFENLVGEAHARSLKVMVDLVINHTSDQHPWFIESQDPNSDKSDWYIWKDAKDDGSPPNNWGSVFSMEMHDKRLSGEIKVGKDEFTPYNSAWLWHEGRQQYVLHSFAQHQPDLNWQNPEVRDALKDVMRFWLDKGVDGFRMDVASHYGKDPQFRDEPIDPKYHERDRQETIFDDPVRMEYPNPYDQLAVKYSAGYMPILEKYLKEITTVLNEYPAKDRRIIFEAYLDQARLEQIAAISPDNASTFNFTCYSVPWNASEYKKYLEAYHAHLHPQATPNQVRGNHDRSRTASPHELGYWAARSLAVLNLTLPGNIYIYNGEELGMQDVEVPVEKIDDNLGFRDTARTPMLWNDSDNAGFSLADETWLPIDPLYQFRNAKLQLSEPDSTLNLYKQLLSLRRLSPALNENSPFATIDLDNPDVLAFKRSGKGETLITLVNFSDSTTSTNLDYIGDYKNSTILISSRSRNDSSFDINNLTLEPNEAIVIKID